jgi:hypothetical protein
VSNDNPFSESHFKTLKYTPDYSGRFEDAEQAREWVRRFVPHYNDRPHEGLALFTPADAFLGRVATVAAIRQQALDDHYATTPSATSTARPPSPCRLPLCTSTPTSPWMPPNYSTPPVHFASSPPLSTPCYPKLLHKNLAPCVGKLLTRSEEGILRAEHIGRPTRTILSPHPYTYPQPRAVFLGFLPC